MPVSNSSLRVVRSTLAYAAAFAALVGASTTLAQAQSSQGRAVAQACAADVRTLCPGVQPGGGRILQCLFKKHASVSDKCKQAAREARAAHQSSGS